MGYCLVSRSMFWVCGLTEVRSTRPHCAHSFTRLTCMPLCATGRLTAFIVLMPLTFLRVMLPASYGEKQLVSLAGTSVCFDALSMMQTLAAGPHVMCALTLHLGHRDARGHIVTRYHVVKGLAEVKASGSQPHVTRRHG